MGFAGVQNSQPISIPQRNPWVNGQEMQKKGAQYHMHDQRNPLQHRFASYLVSHLHHRIHFFQHNSQTMLPGLKYLKTWVYKSSWSCPESVQLKCMSCCPTNSFCRWLETDIGLKDHWAQDHNLWVSRNGFHLAVGWICWDINFGGRTHGWLARMMSLRKKAGIWLVNRYGRKMPVSGSGCIFWDLDWKAIIWMFDDAKRWLKVVVCVFLL